MMSLPLKILIIAAVCLLGLAAAGRVPLRYNYRNLTIRWKTTLLTALAFTLVVALLTVMMAFVHGMNRLTEASGHAENVIVLADGATDEIFSNLSPMDISDLENQPGILAHGSRRLASREVYMVVTQPVANPQPGRQKRRYLQVRGMEDPRIAAEVHQIDVFPGGRWFAPSGVQPVKGPSGELLPGRSMIEAVLGDGIAREMALDRTAEERATARNPDRLEPGDTFHLDERPWLVVGVMQSAGLTFDSEVWAKREIVGPMFGKNNYTSLVARTAGPDDAQRLKDFFTRDYKKAAVQAQVETDYYASLGETSKQFAWAVGFVTVVMSIGGVFGVMNTMFAAISQRIRDIGVMRLLGYGRREILVSFLLESLMIALVGGLLGCALGALTDGWSATSVVSSGPGGGKSVVLKLVIDADIIATGLIVALAMGFIGGIVPALLTTMRKLLDTLR